MAGNTARLAGGAAAAVVLAVIVIALFPRLAPNVDDTGAAAEPDAIAPVAATSQTSTDAENVALPGPTVDTFLLGPDGVAVVAGQATPGATVTVLLDGAPLAQALADASGSFAATAEVTASDTPRRLTFAENGARPSGESVLVRPGTGGSVATQIVDEPTMPIADPNLTATDAGGDRADATMMVAGTDGTAATGAAPDAGTIPSNSTGVADAAAAPTIVVDAAGARVLGQGPQVMDRVALDAITYDAQGGVQLAGRAPGNGTVQVYVDNAPVTTGPVGAKGDWRLALPDVDPGTYTLRIDELAPDGTVNSRVETPFRRESPADVAALQSGDGGMTVTTQTVQPGNTLWAIARDNLGEGLMYVRVFEANADQIRNPDLIYPGQVFVIPDR